MKPETQQLFDYIKSVIQTCEDADRKAIAEAKTKELYVPCPMKDGYSRSFEFDYSDDTYGSGEVRGKFEYYNMGTLFFDGFEYETDELPLPSLAFLTEEEYESELAPALTSWLEERVRNEPFGGLYSADFRLSLLISNDEDCEVRRAIVVSDPKRKETRREMVCTLVRDKTYKTMNVKSDEYKPVIKDILYTIPSLLGELPAGALKDAIATIARKYKKADRGYFDSAVLYPLYAVCYNRLIKEVGVDDWGDSVTELTDEHIPDEELDFLCWIALQIIKDADDSDSRENGERVLDLAAQKGFARAKDYLKFGTGNIGKEFTHLKTPKFEAIANDVKRLIEFKVKDEDAGSYGEMLDFIAGLLKQGFPADFQIKINSKLKNYIPVGGLNGKSKTNLFFGNAATFPELWGKMAEYVRTTFDEFTYHSDSSDDEAVTVGGYAVYALGCRDMKANREIVKWFMDKVDTEHDCTAKSFAKSFAKKYLD